MIRGLAKRRRAAPSTPLCARSRCTRPAREWPGLRMKLCEYHKAIQKPVPAAFRNARRELRHGRSFQSKTEADRYSDLLVREQAGAISDLRCQVRFDLRVNGVLIESYYADFVYREDSEQVIEDTKRGRIAADFRRKARWMAAQGNPVQIVTPGPGNTWIVQPA